MKGKPDSQPYHHLEVIAIPEFDRVPSSEKDKLFGRQTWFFEDMVKSWPESPVTPFFYFPKTATHNSEKQFSGYTFDGKKWNPHQQKAGKLTYFRASSHDLVGRFLGKISLNQDCKSTSNTSSGKCLNSPSLIELLTDKPAFHQLLLENDLPTLPALSIEKEIRKFQDNLLDKPNFFLKPRKGSMGEGVFKVSQIPNQGFLLQTSNGRNYPFYQKQDFLEFLKQEINPTDYFLQPAAGTIPFHDRPIDLRVLVQNRLGKYQVTGMGVRLGPKSQSTANLSTGGMALPFSEIEKYYQKHYGKTAKQAVEEITYLCLNTSHLIAKICGEFLEIGFDILFTRTGPIILEGNAKPSRWIFVKIGDYLKSEGKNCQPWYDLRKESCKIPLEYAAWRLGLI